MLSSRTVRTGTPTGVTVGTLKIVPGQIRPTTDEWRVNGTIEIPINVPDVPPINLAFPFKDCPSEHAALQQAIDGLEQLIQGLTTLLERWKGLRPAS